MTNAPRPGWYPDPAGAPERFRWWSGTDWTDELSDTPHAPAPSAVDEESLPRRRSAGRSAVALIVVVALFLSAGAGVGLWYLGAWSGGSSGADRPGPTPSKASASGGPAGQLEEPTRTASIGRASLELPAAPYAVHLDPDSVPGIFDVVFSADATVHAKYDGSNDWLAMVAFVGVDPDLADSDDLDEGGRAVLARMAKKMYAGHATTITRVDYDTRHVDGHPALAISAQVHYAIDQLSSRYDTVHLLLVRPDDDTLVAAISSVPDDAGAEVTRLAADSLASLTIH